MKNHLLTPDGLQTHFFQTVRNNAEFFNAGEIINLSETNKDADNALKLMRDATKLAQHVVRGELENTRQMLEANPELLRVKAAEVTAYSGLKVRNATALQAALRALDVDTGKKENGEPKNDGMVEMLLPFFDKLEGGQAEMARQVHEEFPDGFQVTEEGLPVAEPFDFSAIAEAITNASDAEIQAELDDPDKTELGIPYVARTAINNALREFRQAFREKSQKEKHFNPNHLLKAFAVVDSTQYANWSYAKKILFCRQIIGYVQRYLPACYLQAFAQGLYSIVVEGEPASRSFKFRYDKGHMICPLNSVDDALGFDFWVGDSLGHTRNLGGRRCSWDLDWWWSQATGVRVVLSQFRNYVKQKHQSCRNLFSECSSSPSTQPTAVHRR